MKLGRLWERDALWTPGSLALEGFGRSSANVPSFLCNLLSKGAFLPSFLDRKHFPSLAAFSLGNRFLSLGEEGPFWDRPKDGPFPGQKNQGCSRLVLLV